MDYFKHYSTASRSNLLNHLLEEMGPAGYAYWFLLLELCAEVWDGESPTKFRFHTRILRQKLRISQTKLELFLGFCQGFGSLSFCFSEKWIDLDIPKLAEVKTSRKLIKSNKGLVSVDKDIDTEKERDKEAEVITLANIERPESPEKNLPHDTSQEILSPPDFSLAGVSTVDEFLAYWNETMQLDGFPPAPFFLGASFTNDFFKINRQLKLLNTTWQAYLERVKNSDFLKRKRKGGPPPITWLLNDRNFDEVMAGKYDIEGSQDDDEKLFNAAFGGGW